MKNFLILIIIIGLAGACHAQQRPIEFQDIMKFNQIKDVQMSEKGSYIAFGEVPDRGNRGLVIYNAAGTRLFVIPRGESPVFSADENWVAVSIGQDFFEKEKKLQEKYQPELWLIRLSLPDTIVFKNAENAFFSKNSEWAFITRKLSDKKDSAAANAKQKPVKEPAFELKELTIMRLERRDTTIIRNFLEAVLDSSSTMLYYATLDTTVRQGGLFSRNLLRGFSGISAMDTAGCPFISSLQIDKNDRLAYVRSTFSENLPKNGLLVIANKKESHTVAQNDIPKGWHIPAKNRLTFSRDSQRLFFGICPLPTEKQKATIDSTIDENYSVDAITAKRELDVWHWDDPMIKTQEKNLYKKQSEKLYQQVYDLASGTLHILSDSLITEAPVSNNTRWLLQYSNIPYRKEITWDDYYYDASVFDLQTGKRAQIVPHILETPQLSPAGSFGVYYKERQWHLYDCISGKSRLLNDTITTPFFIEDNDLPALPSSYGVAGWVADTAVLINDRYDIWLFSQSGYTVKNLTKGQGRAAGIVFRVTGTEAGKEFYESTDEILLTAISAIDKSSNYYSLSLASGQLNRLTNEQAKISFRQKAKGAPVYLFTKERFDLFPDLWITGAGFGSAKQLTKLDAQRAPFAWSKAELVHWYSNDGVPLDGVLMKPTDYKEGQRFPLIVYFYELFSQRLFEFPDMVVNHRPNFAYYTSHGYGVLLPDVRFKVGEPGQSAVHCVVPGVLKLIEAGLVDPKGAGLIGHSWSGYEAAYMITQTDLFSAAIAGAPVGNMTSAYSGIRLESGMTRQFQYEKSQSRIGGSLWEYPERYIANSPIFFADRIKTPLLIEQGDEDEAVPFQQGVELYMAMRRLGKVCYFLQYRGEPHHPKKYPNKVDYAVKQKEFFDAYLKHRSLAPWMLKPAPYAE